ncbi:MAG: hypothetical protein G01um101472_456 [Parcubacteria group bacterium Gr01-1014_72]|nr:MAG: hypothetical protein G01um101472_456 [Parcubacteria group bacterium Gr01-1014_72]
MEHGTWNMEHALSLRESGKAYFFLMFQVSCYMIHENKVSASTLKKINEYSPKNEERAERYLALHGNNAGNLLQP